MIKIACIDKRLEVCASRVSKSRLIVTLIGDAPGEFGIPFEADIFMLFVNMNDGLDDWKGECKNRIPNMLKLFDFLDTDTDLVRTFDLTMAGKLCPDSEDEADCIDNAFETSLQILEEFIHYSTSITHLFNAALENIGRWLAKEQSYDATLLNKVKTAIQTLDTTGLHTLIRHCCQEIRYSQPYCYGEEGRVDDIIDMAGFLDGGERVYNAFDAYLEDFIQELLDRSSGYGHWQDYQYQRFIWNGVSDALRPDFPKSLKVCGSMIADHIANGKEHFSNCMEAIENYLRLADEKECSSIGKTVVGYLCDECDLQSLQRIMDDLVSFDFDDCILDIFDVHLHANYSRYGTDIFDADVYGDVHADEFAYDDACTMRERFPWVAELYEDVLCKMDTEMHERSEILCKAFDAAGMGVSPWPQTSEDFAKMGLSVAAQSFVFSFDYSDVGNDAHNTSKILDLQLLGPWFARHFPDQVISPASYYFPERDPVIMRAAVMVGLKALEDEAAPRQLLKSILDFLSRTGVPEYMETAPSDYLKKAFGSSEESFVQMVRAAPGAGIPRDVIYLTIQLYDKDNKHLNERFEISMPEFQKPTMVYKDKACIFTCPSCGYRAGKRKIHRHFVDHGYEPKFIILQGGRFEKLATLATISCGERSPCLID